MKRTKRIKFITGLALLLAVEVVLSIISNYMPGTVNFNLALIPISIGAVLFGPIGGFILGAANGIVTLIAPGTQVFVAQNAFATVLLCILKTGLAGLVSGYVYKAIKIINTNGAIITSGILVPIVNTSIFILGVILFFLPLYGEGKQAIGVLFSSVISINFLIEFLISALLCPAVIQIINVSKRTLGIVDENNNNVNKETKQTKYKIKLTVVIK